MRILVLDQYKNQYDGLVKRVQEQTATVEEYMKQNQIKVGNYFRRTDEHMIKVSQELEETRD